MRTCCWILLSSLLAVPVNAQETRGNISGAVRDAQGVIPGATVAITSSDTGAVQRLVSNSSGYFEAPLVQPGTYYQLTVSMTGYKALTRPGIVVAVGQQVSVTLQLEPGQITEEITITAASPLLDPDLRQHERGAEPSARRPARAPGAHRYPEPAQLRGLQCADYRSRQQ